MYRKGVADISKPTYVGPFYVRCLRGELPAIDPNYVRPPTPGVVEFEEHGSIALRVFAPTHSTEDNTLGRDRKLVLGEMLLVRAKLGGFWTVPLERDQGGWYVQLDALNRGGVRVPVEFCPTRERFVVRRLV